MGEVGKLEMNFTTSKMSTVDYFNSKKYYEKLAALTNPIRKNQYIDMIKQEAAENARISEAERMSEVKVKEEPIDDGYPQHDSSATAAAAGCIKKKKKKSKKSKSQLIEEEENVEEESENGNSEKTDKKKKKKKKSKTQEAETGTLAAADEISNQEE